MVGVELTTITTIYARGLPPFPMKTTKTCTLCQQDLPLDMFNRDSSRADGLRSRCKTCRGRVERKGPRKEVRPVPEIRIKPITVKDRETAYRQALVDLHYKYPEDFKELLQVRLREALTRKP